MPNLKRWKGKEAASITCLQIMASYYKNILHYTGEKESSFCQIKLYTAVTHECHQVSKELIQIAVVKALIKRKIKTQEACTFYYIVFWGFLLLLKRLVGATLFFFHLDYSFSYLILFAAEQECEFLVCLFVWSLTGVMPP